MTSGVLKGSLPYFAQERQDRIRKPLKNENRPPPVVLLFDVLVWNLHSTARYDDRRHSCKLIYSSSLARVGYISSCSQGSRLNGDF